VLQFALAKIGAVLVTVNTSLHAAEIEFLLKQSESCTLITVAGFRDVDYVETIYEVVPELRGSEEGSLRSQKLPFLRNVIYIGNEHPDGMIRYDSLLDRSETTSDAQLDARMAAQGLDTVINMQYTSERAVPERASC
jgi:fatty-acyl-CoA synthase